MTLDKVAGLEDVEAGQGKEAKAPVWTTYLVWDPAKLQKKERDHRPSS